MEQTEHIMFQIINADIDFICEHFFNILIINSMHTYLFKGLYRKGFGMYYIIYTILIKLTPYILEYIFSISIRYTLCIKKIKYLLIQNKRKKSNIFNIKTSIYAMNIKKIYILYVCL